MSKNRNQDYRQYKNYIREQQRMLEEMDSINEQLFRMVNELRMRELRQFADVMSCVLEQCMTGVIDEEQAGQMMVTLVGKMLFTEE